MNILVSGVAGDIGFGAGRILKTWGWSGKLYGIDIHDQHPGDFVFDQCDVAPRAADSHYLEWLASYTAAHKIGLFIPTSEAEIARLAIEHVDSAGSAKIVMANEQAVRTSLDKLECMAFLSTQAIRVPDNGLVGLNEPDRYPVIVKPRSGQGSKSILVIKNNSEFSIWAPAGHVWQEYLSPDDEEYTCPVYRSVTAGTRVLILRRSLQGGLTGRGEVVLNEDIEEYVRSIAELMQLDGAMNVQLRLTATGPCLFEINPRLSSTLVFRDKMGFCDLRWWLLDKVGKKIPLYLPPAAGTKFYRGAQEYISPARAGN